MKGSLVPIETLSSWMLEAEVRMLELSVAEHQLKGMGMEKREQESYHRLLY